MLNGCAHTGNKCVYTQAHPGNNDGRIKSTQFYGSFMRMGEEKSLNMSCNASLSELLQCDTVISIGAIYVQSTLKYDNV